MSNGAGSIAERRRLERLFRAHHRAVWAYARRRAPATVADDVVAETFLVAWRRIDKVPTDPLPWLLAVARRVLATQLRGERRRRKLLERLAEVVSDGDEGAATGEFAAAFAVLSERDREAIALVAWEGLTPTQAAKVVGQPAVSFRVRLHRAKQRLGRELARSPAGSGRPPGESREATTVEEIR